jgi:hypothetical protein
MPGIIEQKIVAETAPLAGLARWRKGTEFGVPNDDARWLQLVQELLVYLANEKIPWTYWAGGPRWVTYPLSTKPKHGVDVPIMTVLTKDYL